MLEHTAQLAGLLVQGYVMAALCADPGELHTGRAAADHGNLALLANGLDHGCDPVFHANDGVDGADGAEQVGAVGHMALVAADAGNDVFLAALIDLLAVIGVVDPAAGHVDEVSAAVSHQIVGNLGILETGGSGNGHLNAALFDLFTYIAHGVDVRSGLFLGGGEAQGMLRIHIAGAEVEDIADALHHLCQLNGVFLGVAAELLLVYAEHALQGEALAHCLPQCSEHLYHVAAAGLDTLGAILVGTVVGDGGEQLCHGVVPVAAVNGDHIKAQRLEILCLLGIVFDHGLEILLGVGGGRLLRAAVHLSMEVAVCACYTEVLVLGSGILHGHGRHIGGRTASTLGTVSGTTRAARTAGALIAGCTGRHAHAALHVGGAHDISTGLGAIEVDGVQQLTEVILCVGIVEVKQVEVAGGVVQSPAHYRHGLLIEVVDGN